LKDYYRALGILDDAEDIIIRAAYRALAQRYHPDKWKGDPLEANRKMSEINEANDTLSDPIKRKKYDEEYFQNRARNESADDEESDANFIAEEDEAWQMALEFFPHLNNQYNELKKLSLIVANTFRAILIEKKSYKNCFKLKKILEEDYYQRYFGDDEEIRSLVKDLIKNGKRKQALQVNKIIRLLGSSVTCEQIKKKLFDDFIASSDIEIKSLIKKLHFEDDKLKHEEIMELLNYLKIYVSNTDRSIWTGMRLYKFQMNGLDVSYDRIDLINYLKENIK